MKTLLASSTLAAALAAVTVHAGEAPAPRPVYKPSVLMETMSSMVRDIARSEDTHAPMRSRLDALMTFRHSPEIAQKLVKVYGSERPWTLVRSSRPNGSLDYLATLAPLHYVGDDGGTVDWTPLTLKMSLDKTGRVMRSQGSWSSIVAEDKDVRMTVRDSTLTSKLKRGGGDVWYGSMKAGTASVAIDAKAPGVTVRLDDIRIAGESIERAKVAELRYQVGVKAVSAAGERIDNVRVGIRITNIDKALMVEMKDFDKRAVPESESPEQQLAAMKPMLRSMGKAAIRRGTAIEIDELSAGYKGHTASVKGRIVFEGAHEADLDALPSLLKKIVARFSVRVPAPMVRDIANTVASKQASAQAKGPANPQTVAQLSQSMYDIIIGKLIGNGYARMDNDVLLSDIEIRGGVMRVNGKEVALPKMGAPAPSVAVTPQPSVLRARRVDSRCPAPDYPADVVAADQAMAVSIRFVVKADGTIGDVALIKPSQAPAFDQALVAAMERCIYIPGLVNGKPVDMPTTLHITRDPGAARPW